MTVPISTPVRQRRKIRNQKDKGLEFMISPIVKPDKTYDSIVLEKVPLSESFLKEIELNQKEKENKNMSNVVELAVEERDDRLSKNVNAQSTYEHKDSFDELLSKNSLILDVGKKCDKILNHDESTEIPIIKRKQKTSLFKIRGMKNKMKEKLTRSKSTSHLTEMSNNSMASLPRPPSFSDISNYQLPVESELGILTSNMTNTSEKLADDYLDDKLKARENKNTEELSTIHCDKVRNSPKFAQQFDENETIDKTLEEVPVSFVSKRKNKKSVAINLVPVVQNINYYPEDSQSEINQRMSTRKSVKNSTERKQKSVCFSSNDINPRASVCDKTSNLENVRMPSGKWRKTLSLWRRSHANFNKSGNA